MRAGARLQPAFVCSGRSGPGHLAWGWRRTPSFVSGFFRLLLGLLVLGYILLELFSVGIVGFLSQELFILGHSPFF
jgi:hypothetical protein